VEVLTSTLFQSVLWLAAFYGELSDIFKSLATIYLFIYFLLISGGYLTGCSPGIMRK
jgi:hypothetical protein